MRRLDAEYLFEADSFALVRLAWSMNCAPQRRSTDTDGFYRARLVHAIQRAEKDLARSSAEAERTKRVDAVSTHKRRHCGR
jgi:hypothetical protein